MPYVDVRSQLERKRKADAEVDRVEDGARSIFLEEGLVAFLFSEAIDVGFFEGADRVDWDLLKTLRRMTAHLEVSDQPPAAWQSAILQGFEAWRQLSDHGGGLVGCDLDKRALRFVGLPT